MNRHIQKRVEVKRGIRKLGAIMEKGSPIFFDLRKLRKFRKKVATERMHKIKGFSMHDIYLDMKIPFGNPQPVWQRQTGRLYPLAMLPAGFYPLTYRSTS